MSDYRIKSHPILIDDTQASIPFYWQDKQYFAKPNEMISSALMAQGINIFRHHVKDHSPQGIFLRQRDSAPGMVIADWTPRSKLHDRRQT